MRTYRIGDPRVEAYLLAAEERLEKARVFTARGRLLEDARRPRRPARIWLGSVLLAIGHRLIRATPGSAAPA